MNSEEKMWSQLLNRLHPDWKVSLGNLSVGEGALSAGCCVYIVDVASGWKLAGTLAHAQFLQVAQRIRGLPKQHDEVLSIAQALRAVVADGGDPDPQLARALIHGTVQALSLTHTFDVVRSSRNGSLEGHWLYLVYALSDGSCLGRPGFASGSSVGMMSAEMLDHWIAATVRADTLGASSVGRMIEQAGGATVFPAFASR